MLTLCTIRQKKNRTQNEIKKNNNGRQLSIIKENKDTKPTVSNSQHNDRSELTSSDALQSINTTYLLVSVWIISAKICVTYLIANFLQADVDINFVRVLQPVYLKTQRSLDVCFQLVWKQEFLCTVPCENVTLYINSKWPFSMRNAQPSTNINHEESIYLHNIP